MRISDGSGAGMVTISPDRSTRTPIAPQRRPTSPELASDPARAGASSPPTPPRPPRRARPALSPMLDPSATGKRPGEPQPTGDLAGADPGRLEGDVSGLAGDPVAGPAAGPPPEARPIDPSNQPLLLEERVPVEAAGVV